MNPRSHLIFVTPEVFEAISEAIEPHLRFTDPGWADLGFQNILNPESGMAIAFTPRRRG